jgi:hypothetical protein
MIVTETPLQLFDLATKVTSQWALGAFAIAAVVAIVLGTKSRASSKSAPFPVFAWIVLLGAVVVPVTAEVILGLNPDVPYQVAVVVVDSEGGLVSNVHVVSSLGIPPSWIDGVAQFEIPPNKLPPDRSVTFFADKGTRKGEQTLNFPRARSLSTRVILPDSAGAAGTFPAQASTAVGATVSTSEKVIPSESLPVENHAIPPGGTARTASPPALRPHAAANSVAAVPQACPKGWYSHSCAFDILCISSEVEPRYDLSGSEEFKRAGCKRDYEPDGIPASRVRGDGPAPNGPWGACYSQGSWGSVPRIFVRALKLDSSNLDDGADLDRALVNIGLRVPADWEEKCAQGREEGNRAYVDARLKAQSHSK